MDSLRGFRRSLCMAATMSSSFSSSIFMSWRSCSRRHSTGLVLPLANASLAVEMIDENSISATDWPVLNSWLSSLNAHWHCAQHFMQIPVFQAVCSMLINESSNLTVYIQCSLTQTDSVHPYIELLYCSEFRTQSVCTSPSQFLNVLILPVLVLRSSVLSQP